MIPKLTSAVSKTYVGVHLAFLFLSHLLICRVLSSRWTLLNHLETKTRVLPPYSLVVQNGLGFLDGISLDKESSIVTT